MIIDNGTVQLGIKPAGSLVDGSIGLTFLGTGGEALAPGCACEGWGVSDLTTGEFGKAGQSFGNANITSSSITVSGSGTDPASTGSAATASANVSDGAFDVRVTHDFTPSASANLFRADVSIENRAAGDVDNLVYRRAMDWDVPPTEFSEFVTIQGWPATNLIGSSDDGFVDGNPNVALSTLAPDAVLNGNFTDSGPADHGAVFDFSFGTLASGDMQDFQIFYGAAASEADALVALGDVGAEVFSLGQPSTPDGDTLGTPNTFIFGFAGVGGTPVSPGDGVDAVPKTTGTNATLAVGATVVGEIQQDDVSGDYIDADYFRVSLTGGQRYSFSADAGVDGGDTLDEVFIRLRDSQGKTLSPDIRDEGASPDFVFDTPGSGQQTYYLAISAGGGGAWWDDTGAYSVSLTAEGTAPPTNYRPTASATDYTGDPDDIIPLTDLFSYDDPDGLSDIVSFAVQDRTRDGGHLTYLDQQMDPNVVYERPIDQIGDWAFVAGPPGKDYVGFNAIDSEGVFNTSVVASVSGAQVQGPQLASADDLFGQQKLSVLARFAYAAYPENDGVDALRQDGWRIIDSAYADSLNIGRIPFDNNGNPTDHYISGGIGNRGSALLAESPDQETLIIAFTGTDQPELEKPLDWLTATQNHYDLFFPLFRDLNFSIYDKVIVTGHSMAPLWPKPLQHTTLMRISRLKAN